MMKLLLSALTKLLAGLILLCALLFLPAWTFDYPNEWLFLGILFVPMILMGLVLFFKAPELLKKR
ncbi:MAG: isoprenylcysteine carboxylmethyltransferase family protein, partial [Clostridia bacterium]|nr:isoprenylcysteine carboxylmethyltransferase family protein [Clostridia bacterium]